MRPSVIGSIIAGICFIFVCLLLTTYVRLDAYMASTFALSDAARMGFLMFLIAAFGITLIFHMSAYARLGNSYGSPLLRYSTYALMTSLGAFCASVVFLLANTLSRDPILISYANATIGLFVLIGSGVALLFLIALMRLHERFGWWWIVIATIAPVAVMSMWRPWPVAILVALSCVFLYRKSQR